MNLSSMKCTSEASLLVIKLCLGPAELCFASRIVLPRDALVATCGDFLELKWHVWARVRLSSPLVASAQNPVLEDWQLRDWIPHMQPETSHGLRVLSGCHP
jgi:hypothetical protein